MIILMHIKQQSYNQPTDHHLTLFKNTKLLLIARYKHLNDFPESTTSKHVNMPRLSHIDQTTTPDMSRFQLLVIVTYKVYFLGKV